MPTKHSPRRNFLLSSTTGTIALGLDGLELESPEVLDFQGVRAASEQTDRPVHGVVNMGHW